ncbi:MAG: histidine phosphatase family protein [Phenylobacterium sp.]|nr:histidine phosphatase family protein [Phenylobacterium sp.]
MIYLVRHGQTAFNRERRLQGHLDSDLTELGRAQAKAMAGLLADLLALDPPAPWRLVTSPLGRARATAEVIGARLNLPVESDARLMEISCGAWEGRLRREIEAEAPEAFAQSGWAFRAPMGERYEAVSVRLADWLASLPPEPERRVIAVGHGISGRVLRGLYAGLSRDETVNQAVPQDAVFRLMNGQVDRFDCEPAEEA